MEPNIISDVFGTLVELWSPNLNCKMPYKYVILKLAFSFSKMKGAILFLALDYDVGIK